MQIIRLINLLINFAILATVMYISVKKCIIYFHIWSVAITVVALGFLFISSGRQVVERKMKEKNDEVPEKEKS